MALVMEMTDKLEYVSVKELFDILDDMSGIHMFNGKNWYNICPEKLKQRIKELDN